MEILCDKCSKCGKIWILSDKVDGVFDKVDAKEADELLKGLEEKEGGKEK